MRSGQLTIYDLLPLGTQTPSSETLHRPASVSIKFVKSFTKTYDVSRAEDLEQPSVLAEHRKISRLLIPFTTSTSNYNLTYFGVFLSGDTPTWILHTDVGGLMTHPSGHNVVHAFTTCSLWQSKGDFLMYTEDV